MLIERGVIPALNLLLSNGFPLPTIRNIDLVEPKISYHNGHINIATDVKYTGPTKGNFNK
jgi:hypothetical protein